MNAEVHALESAKHDQQIEKLTEQMETLTRLIEMDAENIRPWRALLRRMNTGLTI